MINKKNILDNHKKKHYTTAIFNSYLQYEHRKRMLEEIEKDGTMKKYICPRCELIDTDEYGHACPRCGCWMTSEGSPTYTEIMNGKSKEIPYPFGETK